MATAIFFSFILLFLLGLPITTAGPLPELSPERESARRRMAYSDLPLEWNIVPNEYFVTLKNVCRCRGPDCNAPFNFTESVEVKQRFDDFYQHLQDLGIEYESLSNDTYYDPHKFDYEYLDPEWVERYHNGWYDHDDTIRGNIVSVGTAVKIPGTPSLVLSSLPDVLEVAPQLYNPDTPWQQLKLVGCDGRGSDVTWRLMNVDELNPSLNHLEKEALRDRLYAQYSRMCPMRFFID